MAGLSAKNTKLVLLPVGQAPHRAEVLEPYRQILTVEQTIPFAAAPQPTKIPGMLQQEILIPAVKTPTALPIPAVGQMQLHNVRAAIANHSANINMFRQTGTIKMLPELTATM
jgi:hypothetical protein